MMVAIQERQDATDVAYVLPIAAAMADALEYYIIEGNIYRVVMVRRVYGFERLTMSIGELLTLIHILKAQRNQMNSKHIHQLDDVLKTIEHAKAQLYVQFHEMVIREIMSRLDSINWFLHDCEKGKAECQITFPDEMRNRQRIEELIKALGEEMSTEVADRIGRIDQRLRQVTHRVDFIWPDVMRSTYPEAPYWYLYALPNE